MIAPRNSVRDNSPGQITFCGSEVIPDELKERRQWVVWKLEMRDGKPTKIPYTPSTSRKGSSTDLMTWETFPEALGAFEAGRYDGVGFVFCSVDHYTGVDLDGCRNPETSKLTPEARDIVDDFQGAYTEVSPSGTGGSYHRARKAP